MKARLKFTTVLAASLLACATASAQDLLLQVNRDTGELVLTGSSSDLVDVGGYTIDSSFGTLTNFASFNGIGDDVAEPGWSIVTSQSSPNFLAELNIEEATFSSINDTISLSLGDVYDPTAAQLANGLGSNVEAGDFTLTYADVTAQANLVGSVEFIGEGVANNIGITIDLSDGSATLQNDSPFDDLMITGYLIEAATPGTLNTDTTFTGLGGPFDTDTSPDGENIGETDPTGTGFELDAGQTEALGIVGGNEGDISFTFLLAGEGVVRTGFVEFIGTPGNPGDFNGDGFINAADYTIFRDSFGAAEDILGGNGDGSGTVDIGDFNVFTANFTPEAPAAVSSAVAAVPEPASAATLLIAAAFGFLGSRRERN